MARNPTSKYQTEVISRYYEHLDTIMLQKLGELVTELYLAETAAKQKRLWLRAHKAMLKLKVPPAIIVHIMKKQSVEILAKNLQDWLAKTGKTNI
jgi:4-alpha-glucanotransferase